jgi:hypothetical protein
VTTTISADATSSTMITRVMARRNGAHHGDTIVRGAYDGTFDKTGLPEELVLSNYFGVRDGRIVSLVVILNQPAEY